MIIRMETKILEIRDSATFIPVIAINMNPVSEIHRYYLRRLGYPCDGWPNIAISNLDANGGPLWNDPYGWKESRTYPVAHGWIIEHWPELSDGDVVDVEFILGERSTPKTSERLAP